MKTAEQFEKSISEFYKSFKESKIKRDKIGRFAKQGEGTHNGSVGEGHWELYEIVKEGLSPELKPLFENGRWDLSEFEVDPFGYGLNREGKAEIVAAKIKPRITKPSIKKVETDSNKKHTYVDTDVADYTLDEFGWVRVTPKPGSGYNTTAPDERDPNALWRGMSAEEMESIRKTGKVQSHGGYNLGEEQIGLTFYSGRSATAFTYGGGYQPYQWVPSFGKSGYVVKVKRPAEDRIGQVIGEDHEIGVRGAIEKDDILEIYEIRALAVREGSIDFRLPDFGGVGGYREGSRITPNVTLGYKKIDGGEKVEKSIDVYFINLEKSWSESKIKRDNIGRFSKKDETGSVADGVEAAGEYADKVLALADKSEPKITKSVVEIATLMGVNMEGLPHRKKKKPSLERKLKSDYEENSNMTMEQVAGKIGDAVRYTAVLDANKYVEQVLAFSEAMKERGLIPYDHKFKNFWGNSDYKGINTNWIDKDGQKFELQFHTKESLYVKETESHPIYERLRVEKSVSKKEEYMEELREIWQKIRLPKDFDTLTFNNVFKGAYMG